MTVRMTSLLICTISFLYFSMVTGQTHFTFNTTEDYYPIVLNSVTLDGLSIESGDEVGVFFQNDNSELVCGGAILWDDTGLKAWEDDSQTSEKDGFASGEDLVYRLWDASAQEEYSTFNASYSVGNGQWGNGTFAQVDLEFLTGSSIDDGLGLNFNPDEYLLVETYPNPFNPATKIQYTLLKAAQVKIEIYNASGKHLQTLVDTYQRPGERIVEFDAHNHSSGVYFVHVTAGTQQVNKKITLVK